MSDSAVTSLRIEGGSLAVPKRRDNGVYCFKGVPFAAAPVGALRWRPPQPVSDWGGTRASDTFGPNSMQGVVFDDIDPTVDGTSEDCLYLNVWTTSLETAEPVPVMFWIHGGGFAVGSGSEPRYDGGSLAARGVVVVTVNHRLNALGFLAHPELTKESADRASGNYGLMDLIAALKWVSRNIRAFGGDPKQVTIAGESAGSVGVSALMSSPVARGLFDRAIGESGAMFPSPARTFKRLREAEEEGLQFARKVGAHTLEALRSVPAEVILAAAPGIGFMPIVDGHVMPASPPDAFANRAHNDVALLAGWNKDEGFNFNVLNGRREDSFRAILDEIFGARAAEALAFYPAGAPDQEVASARQLGGDLVIAHGTWAWLEAQKQHGEADVFRYQFNYAPQTPEGWFGDKASAEAGAFHAGELIYVFENLNAFPWRIDENDLTVAKLTSSYWINFIKTGNPNGPGLPEWPSYRHSRKILVLDVEPRARLEDDSERHRFLASVGPSNVRVP
jgi:para-nitrobenzyl esterase